MGLENGLNLKSHKLKYKIYDSVAKYDFAKENVDALFLEYNDELSGGFELLKYVSENK